MWHFDVVWLSTFLWQFHENEGPHDGQSDSTRRQRNGGEYHCVVRNLFSLGTSITGSTDVSQIEKTRIGLLFGEFGGDYHFIAIAAFPLSWSSIASTHDWSIRGHYMVLSFLHSFREKIY